jgi:hypothetical protein
MTNFLIFLNIHLNIVVFFKKLKFEIHIEMILKIFSKKQPKNGGLRGHMWLL